MAYGIGSILGDIDQKADAYRNNPDALAQSYQQNQQLIDLLVLQKLKTDKEAAQRDMQAKMQTPASTIKDQRAQEVMGMTRNEVAQQVTPGLQALGQQMQAAQAQPQAQGISSVPAPNMQQVGMKGGGIIAFQEGSKEPVKGVEKTSPAERMLSNFLETLNTPSTFTGDSTIDSRIASQVAGEARTPEQKALDAAASAKRLDLQKRTGLSGFFTKQTDEEAAAAENALDIIRTTTTSPAATAYISPAPAATAYISPAPEGDGMGTPPVTVATGANTGLRDIERAQIAKAVNTEFPPLERGIPSALPTPTKEAVLEVPTEAVKRAPPPVREAYAKQLADLRGEEESRLESLIAFLKGAGGQSSFAATMMGGSDAMNAREAEVKGEIMDVLGQLEAIDLKEREFGFEERKIGQTDEQLRLQGLRDIATTENNKAQNEIASATQSATQALQEAQAANLGSPTLTDQEMQADTYVKNALEHGSTKSVVALRQEYYRQRVADEQEVALARLGITDETSKQELILKVVKAADEAFGNLPNSFSMTPEEQQTWKTAHMANTYAELKNASSLSTAAPPKVDPNDPAADFYN